MSQEYTYMYTHTVTAVHYRDPVAKDFDQYFINNSIKFSHLLCETYGYNYLHDKEANGGLQ